MKNNGRTTMLFVSFPSRAVSPTIPMSYIYLAAWLEKKGITCRITDIKNVLYPGGKTILSCDEVLEKTLSDIEAKKPEYIGFSCFTSDFNSLIRIGRLIKKRVAAKIVVGGIHATLRPEDFFFEDSPVDFAVIGEGEATLSELIESDLSGKALDGVRGIMYRKRDKAIRTGDRPYIEDLGELPIPAYDKIDMNFYTMPQQTLVRWLFLSGVRIFTARGCPYLCSFCANRAQKVRYRPISSVIEEIEYLKNAYGIDGFYINDDTFCIDRKRTLEFLDAFQKKKFDMVWNIETRVNLIDEELVRCLKNAGCIQIDLGVESGSQDMLDRVGKGIKVDDAIKAFASCRRNKMRTFACFMVNMPGETRAHIDESAALMKKIRATVYGINITIPHIGTKIYEDYVKPELTPAEYDKFIFDNSFKALEDRRFRLTDHDQNEKFIYYAKFKRIGFFKNILDITFDRRYWRMLMKSRRKRLYLIQFLRMLVNKFFKYPIKLLRTVNFKF